MTATHQNTGPPIGGCRPTLSFPTLSNCQWQGEPGPRELASGTPTLELLVETMLNVRDVLLQELRTLDRKLLETARADPAVQTLMTAPGVGAIVALTDRNAIDDSNCFKRSKDIGLWLGFTPTRYQSGQINRRGHFTKAGDASARTAVYKAATTLLGRVVKYPR
jgi:transposase